MARHCEYGPQPKPNILTIARKRWNDGQTLRGMHGLYTRKRWNDGRHCELVDFVALNPAQKRWNDGKHCENS